jgi:hypothetical protein
MEGGAHLKSAVILALTCIVISAGTSTAQTRRGSSQKRPAASTTFAEKQQTEIRAGRQQIAGEIKILSQFLFLFGGIAKGIETAEQANRIREQSSVGMPSTQIEQTKVKFKDSIRNERVGVEQLESSFRLNPVLQTYYTNLAGVGKLAQTAEAQAAGNNFDQSARSLIAVVNRLVDTLVALR